MVQAQIPSQGRPDKVWEIDDHIMLHHENQGKLETVAKRCDCVGNRKLCVLGTNCVSSKQTLISVAYLERI